MKDRLGVRNRGIGGGGRGGVKEGVEEGEGLPEKDYTARALYTASLMILLWFNHNPSSQLASGKLMLI